MEPELYADTVGEISLHGGVVRIDLVALQPGADANAESPDMSFRKRLVMPVDGFVRAFSAMERLMGQMEERGMVSRVAQQAGEDAGSDGATKEEGKSPNFRRTAA